MKCSIKSLLAIMVGAVMLESCNDDYFETTKSDVAKAGNMSFTATVDGAESRASFTEDSLSFMKPNKEISVFSNRQITKFTRNDEGIFVGNCDENNEYYAVSPYCEKHMRGVTSTSLDKLVIYWNGAEQTLDLNENYAPMVAHVQNVVEGIQNVPLKFQNVCAFIKFTTDYSFKSITLKSRGGEMLAAQMLSVGYDETGNPHIYASAMPSETIKLTGKDGGTLEAGTYYIPVLPGKLSAGIDITFTNKYNEKTCTKTLTNRGALVCGKALDLGKINIKSEMIHLAGTGTEANPYLIHDFDQLCEMRDFVNNSTGGADCYKLADDIDGHGAEFQPIGTLKKPFFGKIDGNHKTIKNIKLGHYIAYDAHKESFAEMYGCSCSDNVCVTALFGFVRNATFKDLTIDNMTLPLLNFVSDMGFKYLYVKSPFIGISFGTKDSRTTISGVTITANQNVSTAEAFVSIYGGVIGLSANNLYIDKCTNCSCVDDDRTARALASVPDQDEYSKKESQHFTFAGILGLAIGGLNDYKSERRLDYNANVGITRCRNFGNFNLTLLKNTRVSAAGILGKAYEYKFDDDVAVSIFSCVNFGTIRTNGTGSVKPKSKENGVERSECVGGIVGLMDSDGYSGNDPIIANCVNNGELHTFYTAGAIIGVPYAYNSVQQLCTENSKPIRIYYCVSHTFNAIVGEAEDKVSIGDCFCTKQSPVTLIVDRMNKEIASFHQMSSLLYCKWKVCDSDYKKIDLDF